MTDLYTVWFKGDDDEPSSIAYQGRKPFCTADKTHAEIYVTELEEANPSCKGLYVVKQLVDAREE